LLLQYSYQTIRFQLLCKAGSVQKENNDEGYN